jgi:hypothetical protein
VLLERRFLKRFLNVKYYALIVIEFYMPITKICSSCKTSYLIREFYWKVRSKNIRQSTCKDCRSLIYRSYSQSSKVRRQIKNRGKIYYLNTKKNIFENNKNWLNKVKLIVGCTICSFNKHPSALDAHHIYNKTARVSTLLARQRNVLVRELFKCIILCANCHKCIHMSHIKLSRNQIKIAKYNLFQAVKTIRR